MTRHRGLHRLRASVAVLAVAATLAAAAAAGAPSEVQRPPGQLHAEPVAGHDGEPFLAGERYTGTFADPTVLRLPDGRYLASATTVANLNLPLMISDDLETWTARPPMPDWQRWSDWRLYNESMVAKPRWAATRRHRGRVALISQWAPDLAKVGNRYLAAYSAAVRLSPRRSCIGIAYSGSPLGQYRDPRAKPLVCFRASPAGSIDPDIFVSGGRAYLLWKNEGVPRKAPPALMVRRLTADGSGFASGSRPRALIKRDRAWEGGVVENPSMVRVGEQHLLFYSGNAWRTADYATGYAVCTGPLGPCWKPRGNRVLATGGDRAGTGGASAFLDDEGRLRLAHHAFDAEDVGEGRMRRLYVATAEVSGSRVTITDSGTRRE